MCEWNTDIQNEVVDFQINLFLGKAEIERKAISNVTGVQGRGRTGNVTG